MSVSRCVRFATFHLSQQSFCKVLIGRTAAVKTDTHTHTLQRTVDVSLQVRMGPRTGSPYYTATELYNTHTKTQPHHTRCVRRDWW